MSFNIFMLKWLIFKEKARILSFELKKIYDSCLRYDILALSYMGSHRKNALLGIAWKGVFL